MGQWIGPCMCRAVGGDWNQGEYPFVRQGVMHSPVGCIRQELSVYDLKKMYLEMTGFCFSNDSCFTLFQVVMTYLKQNPEYASKFPVILTPVPTLQPLNPTQNGLENNRLVHEKLTDVPGEGVGSKIKQAKEKIIVVSHGPIKPPWEK